MLGAYLPYNREYRRPKYSNSSYALPTHATNFSPLDNLPCDLQAARQPPDVALLPIYILHARSSIMSSINRFLSRRDRNNHGSNQKKVMSPPPSIPLPVSDSSSTSSSSTSIGAFAPLSSFYRHTSSSSLSSLSLAFATQASKRSPLTLATEGIIQASTANSSEDLLLQPKQTGGLLHGLFPNEDKSLPEKDEEKKA